ncbi:MAG: hypothetical protein QGF53_09665 [Alphaproteobacteria bacterium]|jgi:bacterioferritin-associated ferredoxin|nr:hypothetical protein [Alphaproteobacteria bacterium]
MYVCLCNGYREDELRELGSRGIVSPTLAYETLGSGPNCGCCLEFAAKVLSQAHSSAGTAAASTG